MQTKRKALNTAIVDSEGLTLAEYVALRRGAGLSYNDLQFEIRTITGISVSDTSLRTWFPGFE